MEKIKCPKCGAELSNDDSFCPACGAYISVELREEIRKENGEKPASTPLFEEEKKCSKCGQIVGKDDKFCEYCGASLVSEPNNDHYCPNCQSKIDADTLYCPFCGKKVSVDELDIDCSNDNDKDVENFVGIEKAGYYNQKFKDIESGKKITWNWCSLLFGGFWLFYRKIYSIGIINLIISSILTFLVFIGVITEDVQSLISIVIWVALGVFGNLFYYKKYQKVLNETKNMTPKAKENYLKEKGGTSVGMIFAYIGIAILIEIIVFI